MVDESAVELMQLDVLVDSGNGEGEEEEESAQHILQNITCALDGWLERISLLEERQHQMVNLKEKVNRVLSQIQQDGLISIYDFGMLNYIGDIWVNLIDLLSSNSKMEYSTKKLVINNLLRLYETRHISMELFTETVLGLL